MAPSSAVVPLPAPAARPSAQPAPGDRTPLSGT